MFYISVKRKTVTEGEWGKRVTDFGRMMPTVGNGRFIRIEGKKELVDV